MFLHPVVEVPAVGTVDRSPVFESLGDDEAGIEDRHGEHDQRQEEGDDGIRLQRSLHRDDPRAGKPSRLEPVSPMKVLAGGKPWRRKPSAARR
jgi:hypothetical protein